MYMLHGLTADEVWRKAYAAVTTAQGGIQPSRAGDTFELLHVALEIADPRQRWVTSRSPAINPAFGIAEALWMLAGSNNSAELNYWFPRLPAFAGEGSTYDGAYGHRLRKHFGMDQVRQACDALSSDPSSRQVVLQLWDARIDLPANGGIPRSADIPCNLVSLLKVRNGLLEWTQVMRSNDLHRGLPYNLVQFTMLQEIMAGWLGLQVGSYHHWNDSLHVYLEARREFSCTPKPGIAINSDSLAIEHGRGEMLLAELYERMKELSRGGVTESRLENLMNIASAPIAYQNLLRVLGAEVARRCARYDQAEALMAECTNPQLVASWSAWRDRTRNNAAVRRTAARL